MKCIFVNCVRPVPEGERACKVHDYWSRVVLADKRYRTEPAPVVTAQGIQGVLFA